MTGGTAMQALADVSVVAATRPADVQHLETEPWYAPAGDECALFARAYAQRLPVLLKGPTGCGKTRFVEHMAWRLRRPLVTVACHEDLGASDLTGRWLLDAQGTRWQDGPLARAARLGAILYLDELAEARPDTTVVIHPLTDTRRLLPLERCGELLRAHPDFCLVASCNPGAGTREMKSSTRQRFLALEMDYPAPEREAEIVAHEGGVPLEMAASLVALGLRTRRLRGAGLEEGASTRMLVRAATLIGQGATPVQACRMAVVAPLAEEPEVAEALHAALDASF